MLRYLILCACSLSQAAIMPDNVVPGPKAPFVQPTGNERAELHQSIRAYMNQVPSTVTAHPSAKNFPGTVESTARISRSVNYDSNLINRWDVTAGNAPNLATSPEAWQDTGLYAAPGEVITVTVTSLPKDRKVSIIIGCHRDSLLQLDKWNRFPVITRTFVLKVGENRIANAFGGLLFIKVSSTAENKKSFEPVEAATPLQFNEVVASPIYTLGIDSQETWSSSRLTPGPWGTLVGKRIILHVPSHLLRDLPEPKELLEWWDKVLEVEDDFIALDRFAPERVVPDIQISAGFMHSGYPFMCQLKASGRHIVDLARLKAEGDWGFFHELGHNHQRHDWTFPGQVEVTCNFFSLLVMEKVVGKPTGAGHDSMKNLDALMAKRLASPPNLGAFEQLAPFVVLIRAHSWEPLRATIRSYRTTPLPPADANGKRSIGILQTEFVLRYGQNAKSDVSAFFISLGYQVSEDCQKALKAYPTFVYQPSTASK